MNPSCKKLFAILAVAMMMFTALCVIGTTDNSIAENTNAVNTPITLSTTTTTKDLEDRFGSGKVNYSFDQTTNTAVITFMDKSNWTCNLTVDSKDAIYAGGFNLKIVLDDCDVKITAVGDYTAETSRLYASGIRCASIGNAGGAVELTGNGKLTLDLSGVIGSEVYLDGLTCTNGIGHVSGGNNELKINNGAKIVCEQNTGRTGKIYGNTGLRCSVLKMNHAEAYIDCATASYESHGLEAGVFVTATESSVEYSKIHIEVKSGANDNYGMSMMGASLSVKDSDISVEMANEGINSGILCEASMADCSLNVQNSTISVDCSSTTGINHGIGFTNTTINESILKIDGNATDGSYGLYVNTTKNFSLKDSNIDITAGKYVFYNDSGLTAGVNILENSVDSCKLYDGFGAEITPSGGEYATSNLTVVKSVPSDGENYFNVTFNLNADDGFATPVWKPIKAGGSVTVPYAYKYGYVSVKWQNGGTEYDPNSSYTFNAKTELTVKTWGHFVKYVAEGMTPPETVIMAEGDSITLPTEPVKAGMTLTWVDNDGISHNAGSTYTMPVRTKDVTMTANWISSEIALEITSPKSGSTVDTEIIDVTGTTNAESVAIKVNGTDAGAVTLESGSFTKSVTLTEGKNTIEVTATTATGSMVSKTVTITYEASEPTPSGGNGDGFNIALLIIFVLATLATVVIGTYPKK